MKKKKKVKESKTKSLVHFLKKQPHQYVDQKFQQAHDEVFEEISCLDCANCCKTLGPRIKSSDIKRISKFIGISIKKFQNDFEQRFIHQINMQVKQAIKENEDFIYKQLIKVNTGKLEANKVMTSDEMNKKVLHMELQIMELKRQSNPYVLGVQVRDLGLKLERMNTEMKSLK